MRRWSHGSKVKWIGGIDSHPARYRGEVHLTAANSSVRPPFNDSCFLAVNSRDSKSPRYLYLLFGWRMMFIIHKAQISS